MSSNQCEEEATQSHGDIELSPGDDNSPDNDEKDLVEEEEEDSSNTNNIVFDLCEDKLDDLYNKLVETMAIHEGLNPEFESTFAWHQFQCLAFQCLKRKEAKKEHEELKQEQETNRPLLILTEALMSIKSDSLKLSDKILYDKIVQTMAGL